MLQCYSFFGKIKREKEKGGSAQKKKPVEENFHRLNRIFTGNTATDDSRQVARDDCRFTDFIPGLYAAITGINFKQKCLFSLLFEYKKIRSD